MASIRSVEGLKGVSWEVRIRRKGSPTLTKTFKSKQAASKWAAVQEGKLIEGHTVSRTSEKVLISDVIDWFREKHAAELDSVQGKNEGLRLDALSHDLGKISVKQLTHERIDKYIATLLETNVPAPANKKKTHPLYNGDRIHTYAPSTVRKLYYTLKKVVEAHSFAHGYPLDRNQFRGQQVPAGWSGARTRRLEDGEEEKLYAAVERGYTLKDEWKRVIGFALETACRAQEIILSRRNDLNLEGRSVIPPFLAAVRSRGG